MGAVYWGFTLYFGRSEDAMRFKEKFAKAIGPFTPDSKPLKKTRGSYSVHLKVPGSEQGGVAYHITTGPSDSELNLITDMSDGVTEVDLLDDVMLAIAQKLGPTCALSIIETHDTANEHAAIFYRNPYFFLMEPPGTSSSESIENFLEDEMTLQKISEFKRILPLEELIAILRQHCKQVFVGERGVGILKGNYSSEEACVYPHYFLRQLVRSRGVSLDEGFAEKYAREFGIK